MPPPSLRLVAATLPLLLGASPWALAEPIAPPTRGEAEAALAPTPTPFSPAQLDQMLAPIALYPDQLLTDVLMAATFPQQVVDARKWLQDPAHAALKGDALVDALRPLPWDASVKSLVAFPQVVAMMNDHLEWAEALGTAFADQEVETMARVQSLRQRAMQAGQLKSTPQLAVDKASGDIVIAPAEPDMVYVPVYNPAVVYGAWPDAELPPVYIPPPPGFVNGPLGPGIGFSVGFGVVAPLWGWGHLDWHQHVVDIDPGRYQRITSPADLSRNHIAIEQGVWHRTGPIAEVPAAQRPQPPAPGAAPPPGTVRSTAIAVARPGPEPAVSGPPHPGETHPAEMHPAEAPHPGPELGAVAPPHPGEAHPAEAPPAAPRVAEHPPVPAPHPGPSEMHPAAMPRPPGPAPHPGPPGGGPHPGAGPHPGPAPAGPPGDHPGPGPDQH
ncbi:MAG TPA: DUF3300 domain-containing protein [Stellaceae bacterium]|nr:DUF3300 domain-containing protein [Stellaceae bacterium]